MVRAFLPDIDKKNIWAFWHNHFFEPIMKNKKVEKSSYSKSNMYLFSFLKLFDRIRISWFMVYSLSTIVFTIKLPH